MENNNKQINIKENETENEKENKEIGLNFDSSKIFKSKLKRIAYFSIGSLILLAVIVNVAKGKKTKLEPISTRETMELDAGTKAIDTDNTRFHL